MKSRSFSVILLLVLLGTMTGNAQANSPISPDQMALVYVYLDSSGDMNSFASTQLPMYDMLDGGLLTGTNRAGQQTLQEAGLSFKMLDNDVSTGTYYLAETILSRLAPDFASYGKVLLKTANGVLLQMDPLQVSTLTQAGAELRAITLTPKPLPTAQNEGIFSEVVVPDPIIQGMIDQVTETQVYTYDRQLAGELPVWVDGSWYTFPSHYTYSGTPIEKTMHFVYQHMQDLGLDVEYHQWGGVTYPNVIGEIPGITNPDDIFIIGSHIDDFQYTPGADDNGSGAVATLLAADILSHYQWGCTLRFAFWTAEEQGFLGSNAYAKRAHDAGENILGYLNLDMLAWNTIGSAPIINLYYEPTVPPSLPLAQLFASVVSAYNLDLDPILGTGEYASDHVSFWRYGFTSILAIEDYQRDFNPNIHEPGDTPAHTDPAYFTDFVKASIATYAHMSGCLIPGPKGYLDGHVTTANSEVPIEGVTVTANDGQGNNYSATTDLTGYYTMTLPPGNFTVTASPVGYSPQSQSATIIFNKVTSLDFALQQVSCEAVTGLNFTWLPLDPVYGELVTFTGSSVGSEPFAYTWDFGDSSSGIGRTATHTYANSGAYTVAFTAANTCGKASSEHVVAITKRPVTVTAGAKSKGVGQPDPQLTYQITSGSLLSGDAFTGTLIREPGEATGTYTILQGTLLLPEYYDIIYVGADLTIFGGMIFIPLMQR